MAVGDLIGEMASTYMTPAERAAKMGLRPNSFDITNTGPIAKASQQLTSLSQVAPQTAPASTPDPVSAPTPTPTSMPSLSSALPAGIAASPPAASPPDLSQAYTQSTGLPAQTPTSFAEAGANIGRSLLQNPQLAAQQQPAPIAEAPPAVATPAPTAPDLRSIDTTAQANVQPPVTSLGDAYRPVVGTADTSNGRASIVGKLNPDGTASFSNDKTDLRSAYGMAPVNDPKTLSPTDQANIENAAGSGPSFAALGSAKNMGDGVGSFSQFNQGDAKLAMDRFQKAADLRQGYKEQDALAIARQQASIDSSVNTIRDSSQPITRNDLAQAALDQQGRQSDQQAILNAQNGITSGQAQRSAAAQARQAQNVEDLRVAAAAPDATPQAKAAYNSVIDPDGSKALARQVQQAQIGKTNAEAGKTRAETDTAPGLAKSQIGKNEAETAKLTGEANGTGAAGQQRQLNQLEIDKRKTDAANAAQALTTQKAGAYDLSKEALKLVGDIAGSKSLDDVTGTVRSKVPTLRDESQDLVNKAQRLQTLLTVDNLKLMSGVLTDKDITFLSQVGSGLNIGDKGINGSVGATKQRLSDIAERLSGKLTEYEKANPNAGKPQATQQAQSQAPAAQPQTPPVISGPVQIVDAAGYAALPSGAEYIDPNGVHRSKR
jgi:hypothetical protein